MALTVWVGDVSPYWYEEENWSPRRVPGPSDVAIFGPDSGRCILDGSATIQGLRLLSNYADAFEFSGTLRLTGDESYVLGGQLRASSTGPFWKWTAACSPLTTG